MAERYAVATGGWSSTSTWDGGTLPGSGDDVFANGQTVIIDIDVIVNSVRTTAGVGGYATTGRFHTSGSVTVTADSYAGDTDCLYLNSGGTQAGDAYGSDINSYEVGTFINTGGIMNGDAYAGGVIGRAVQVSSGGIMNGNGYGGDISNAHGVYVMSGGIFNGNATGGTASSAYGAYLNGGATMNGDTTGGTLGVGALVSAGAVLHGDAYGTAAAGATVQAGGFLNGDAFGGTTVSGYGVFLSGGYHNGNTTGGSVDGAYGTLMQNGGLYYGAATGGAVSGAHGCYGSNGSILLVTTAIGNTAGAYGVYTSGGYMIAIIESESGLYPKLLDSDTDTTYDNIPFAEPTEIVKLLGMQAV